MKKTIICISCLFVFNSLAYASSDAPSLDEALLILKSKNLEIKSATLDIQAAKEDKAIAKANHFGKLDIVQDFARSNDAGNVFGFKLSSREADFGDFGSQEFMDNQAACGGGDPVACANLYTKPPKNLNYPGYRNYFQTKLKYEVPLFTGFMISSYSDIMDKVSDIKTLEKSKIIAKKTYELKKSYYDMALLEESISNLKVILKNIDTLENMTHEMIEVGYAKRVDLLEVRAKKGNVERLISQMDLNEKLLYHYISFLLDEKTTKITTPNLNQIEQNILSNDEIIEQNIDIKMANEALIIKDKMLDVAKSSFYPMVGAFAEVSTADDKFFNEANDHKAYTIGARASLNIFNGGADWANVEKARLEKLKMQNQVALANSGIALQIDKIKTEIQSYNGDIESLKKELALADEIYENYEARYKEKLVSMSDVIIKQSEQIEKILQLQQITNQRNERVFALEELANGEIK